MLQIKTNAYKIIVSLTLLIALFFFGISFFVKHNHKTESSQVGSSMTKNDESLTFKNANYYKNSDLLELEFIYQGSLDSGLDELDIKAFNAQNKTQIPAKLEQINLNYYVVFVPNVPKLKQVLVQFLSKDKEHRQPEALGTVSVTPKNVHVLDTFKKHTSSYYEKRYASDLVDISTKTIQEYDTKIKNYQNQIKYFERASEQLETQLEFETADEQADTQSEIQNNNSQIETLKSQIFDAQKEQNKLQDKIKMLQEK